LTKVPNKVFFTRGVGRSKEKLQSFEIALRAAGIEKFNLVRVSSIFPPGCKIVSKDVGLPLIKPGEIVFCVMADNATNEPNRMVSAAVGLAVPKNKERYGYLSEHHAFGETEKRSSDYSEDLAATMLASTLGIEFDPNRAYDERKEIYRMSGGIVTSRSIAQSARGHKDGLWTTVVAAAVFCDYED